MAKEQKGQKKPEKQEDLNQDPTSKESWAKFLDVVATVFKADPEKVREMERKAGIRKPKKPK